MDKKLNPEIFKCVVENAPLISIDFIVKDNNGKILLGKRVNEPAKGYWFTIGGRIFKNETIENAQKRILKEELNFSFYPQHSALSTQHSLLKFIGIYEHFYDTGFHDIPTHYVNLAYEIEIKLYELPKEQHSEYRWFELEELLEAGDVHKYVKDYFKGS